MRVRLRHLDSPAGAHRPFRRRRRYSGRPACPASRRRLSYPERRASEGRARLLSRRSRASRRWRHPLSGRYLGCCCSRCVLFRSPSPLHDQERAHGRAPLGAPEFSLQPLERCGRCSSSCSGSLQRLQVADRHRDAHAAAAMMRLLPKNDSRFLPTATASPSRLRARRGRLPLLGTRERVVVAVRPAAEPCAASKDLLVASAIGGASVFPPAQKSGVCRALPRVSPRR